MPTRPPRLPTRSRRALLAGGAAIVAASAVPAVLSTAKAAAPESRPASEPFGYCLNASTISGANLSIAEQIDVAAKAGYSAIEPWIRDLEAYEKKGGAIADVAKRARDLGLTIPSVIGFAKWVVNDDAERAKGLEQMKRDMDLAARLGGLRVAAPPIGAQQANAPDVDLTAAAERYRAVLDLGDQMGVGAECEFWGHSKNLSRLAQAAAVAIGSGHPKACLLPDVYHLYKGGSDPAGLRLLSGKAFHVIHLNDYPADPPRAAITDASRVYPGDGVAPLGDIFRTLRDIGFRGFLSLELFNRDYWKLSPQKVAQTGIDKLRAAVQKALG